jgi:hypothetical protein
MSIVALFICLLGVLGLLAAALMGAGLYFALQVIRPKVYTVEETYRTEIETGRMSEAEWLAWEKQEITLRSPHGYPLFGVYLPLAGAQKTVIIAHGITYSLFGSVKYVNIFRKRGFNVLLYDHRNHGRSGGRWSTFGWYEKDDLAAWYAWAQGILPNGGPVGVMGESFGAATAVQFAARTPGLAFLVSDCSFSDLNDLLTYHLDADYHLPAFPLLPLASLWSQVLSGMSFEAISPLRDAAQLTCPAFFIHGREDVFTPTRMSEALYAAAGSPLKELYLAPNADHAGSFWNNQVEYDRRVGEFLEKLRL